MTGRPSAGQATPRSTRHVWIAGLGFHDVARQGLVVAWARRSTGWSALCVWVEPGPDGLDQLIQRWLPVDRLSPVRTGPEQSAPTEPVTARPPSKATRPRPRPGDYPAPFRPAGRP